MKLDIGEIIVCIRESKGMSQKVLAKKAGISGAGLSDIESGKKKPRYPTLEKISGALGMEVAELLSYNSGSLKNIDILENGISKELSEWLKSADSVPYIKFAYNISKQVPSNLLCSIKFLIDFDNSGGIKA